MLCWLLDVPRSYVQALLQCHTALLHHLHLHSSPFPLLLLLFASPNWPLPTVYAQPPSLIPHSAPPKEKGRGGRKVHSYRLKMQCTVYIVHVIPQGYPRARYTCLKCKTTQQLRWQSHSSAQYSPWWVTEWGHQPQSLCSKANHSNQIFSIDNFIPISINWPSQIN